MEMKDQPLTPLLLLISVIESVNQSCEGLISSRTGAIAAPASRVTEDSPAFLRCRDSPPGLQGPPEGVCADGGGGGNGGGRSARDPADIPAALRRKRREREGGGDEA